MTAPAEQRALLEGLFVAVDGQDLDAFENFLAEDAVFRFGSAPEVVGRGAIREAVAGFYATIAGLQHELKNILAGESLLVCEGEVTYTRSDEGTITLPFTNVFDLDGELISGYRIYIDIAPLYAE